MKPKPVPEVVEAARKMDETGKVNPAYKAARVQMCLLLKPVIEAMMKANQIRKPVAKSKVDQNSDQPKEDSDKQKTVKEIAKLAGVSHDTSKHATRSQTDRLGCERSNDWELLT